MSPEYISDLVFALMFLNGVAIGALTFGMHYRRKWEHEVENARAQRATARNIGVYRIRNTIIDACYIGSTTRSFAARWGEHVADLDAGRHTSATLQRDWQIYGPEAFAFEVVESMVGDEKAIRAREQQWIATLARMAPRCLIYNGVAYGRQAHPIGGVR